MIRYTASRILPLGPFSGTGTPCTPTTQGLSRFIFLVIRLQLQREQREQRDFFLGNVNQQQPQPGTPTSGKEMSMRVPRLMGLHYS